MSNYSRIQNKQSHIRICYQHRDVLILLSALPTQKSQQYCFLELVKVGGFIKCGLATKEWLPQRPMVAVLTGREHQTMLQPL